MATEPALLVVDDDATTRELVKTVARNLGWRHEILEAASGASAVTIATEAPVVTAVLDVQMPILDGVRAAEAIWNYCPELPVIFHTSEPPPEPLLQRARAIEKGNLDDLSAALAALVARTPPRPQCERPEVVVLQTLLATRDGSPLVVLNPAGQIMFANLAAASLYDLPFPARGQTFRPLLRAAAGPSGGPAPQPFFEVLETGLPREVEVLVGPSADAATAVRITAVPHRTVDGEITSVSLMGRIRHGPKV